MRLFLLIIILTILTAAQADNLESEIIKDLNSLLNPGKTVSSPETGNQPAPQAASKGNSDSFSQLSLGRNSLRKILTSLAELSNVNIFMDESVPDKNVQLMVRDLAPSEALKYIAMSNSLKIKIIDEKNLFVFPTQKEANYSGEEIVRTFILKYTDATQLAAIIKATDRTVKSFVNEKNNAIVVFASEEHMKKIDAIIEELDARKPQVMLDVQLLEVESKSLDELGLKFASPLASIKFRDIHPAADSTSGDRLYIKSPEATYEALKNSSNAKLLARPKIILMAKETAKIRIGDRIPVEIVSSETTEGINRQNNRIEWIDAGIKLEAELLNLNGESEATVSIKTEISTPVDSITTTDSNIPQLRTREADSKLRISDGETVILGGLTNHQERRLRTHRPTILSKLPIFGNMFKRREQEMIKTEIVVFITPTFIS